MPRGEPLIRQWNLLKTLQAMRYGQTADELAKRLDSCKRTVQRDLIVLQQVGFPIRHETRDLGRRYWMLEPRALDHGGLSLSMTEMLSLFLSQQLLAPLAGTQFGDGLASAIEKVRAMLPKDALSYFWDERTLLVKSAPTADYTGRDKEIAIINNAMGACRVLRIRYHSASKDREFETDFHPYGLVFLHMNLYCIGLMPEYGEVRTLRVSRFRGVQMTADKFERPPGFSLRGYTHGSFGIIRSGRFQTIRVRFTEWAATSVREQKWHASQKIVKDAHHNSPSPRGEGRGEGTARNEVIAEFELCDTMEFKRWLLGFGRHAVVLKPGKLAAEISAELASAGAAYGR